MSAHVVRLPEYGAAELKAYGRRFMTVGAAGSASLVVTAVALSVLVLRWTRHGPLIPPDRPVFQWVPPPPPPPLSPHPAQPIAPPAPEARPPAVGIPVPVPDEVAPPDNTLARPDQYAQPMPRGDTEGTIQIAIPEERSDTVPTPGGYVYHDEEAEAIKVVSPRYPDIARQAGIEGQVVILALVGADGRVHAVKPETGAPVLVAAAVDAVMQYVFKPALANKRPVTVWVEVPIRFQLDSP
ncbi:MAG TPA: TonB family protein [Candidatus Saccharimonadales bacterium]|nr:TonB family protein [Candidatus Saccharimonadales bacterium]